MFFNAKNFFLQGRTAWRQHLVAALWIRILLPQKPWCGTSQLYIQISQHAPVHLVSRNVPQEHMAHSRLCANWIQMIHWLIWLGEIYQNTYWNQRMNLLREGKVTRLLGFVVKNSLGKVIVMIKITVTFIVIMITYHYHPSLY